MPSRGTKSFQKFLELGRANRAKLFRATSVFATEINNKYMYYLYILKCAGHSLYTGITTNLDRRVAEHNGTGAKPGAKYTAAHRPVRLIYSKKFKNRSLACREEARIKKLDRSLKLELVKEFAKKKVSKKK